MTIASIIDAVLSATLYPIVGVILHFLILNLEPVFPTVAQRLRHILDNRLPKTAHKYTRRQHASLLLPRSPSFSTTVLTEMLSPAQADENGIVFGGEVLCWIDISAGVSARRHAGTHAVTASLDAVHFVNSARVGEILTLTANVNKSWRSSLEVGVDVEAQNVLSGQKRFVCHAYLTFVALENGKPAQTPRLEPETDLEKQRFEEAEIRRQQRMATGSKGSVVSVLKDSLEEYRKIFLWNHNNNAFVESTRIKSIGDTYAEVCRLILPEHANGLGITFGGNILKWMETAAFLSASRFCKSYMVTGSMDAVRFIQPTHVGDVVTFKAIVTETFRTSVEVYICVEREDSRGVKQFTNDAFITMVAVDTSGKPIPVPKLNVLHTESEKKLTSGALERKKKRESQRQTLLKERPK